MLRALRTTPIGDGLPSPAELLQSRQLRTQLTVNRKTLEPRAWQQQEIRDKLAKQQGACFLRQIQNSSTQLILGENVHIREGGTWVPAQVVAHHTPRSYLVRVMGGRTLRRNQSQINKTAETLRTSEPTITSKTTEHKTHQKQKTKASRHTTRQLRMH